MTPQTLAPLAPTPQHPADAAGERTHTMTVEEYPQRGPCDAYLKWTLAWAETSPLPCGKPGRRCVFTPIEKRSGELVLLFAPPGAPKQVPALLCRRHLGLVTDGFGVYLPYDGHPTRTARLFA